MNSHELRYFKTWETNLDDFYFKKIDIDIRRYNKFLFVFKIILTLSHDQAAIERGFSLVKSSLQVNIKQEWIVAKKTIRDQPLANKIDLPSFEMPNKLIIACVTAHSKYKASLEKTAKDSAEVLEKERREVFLEGAKRIGRKKLIRTCESLEKDSTKYSFEAETKSDFEAWKLLVKANTLKRRQNELKIEVKGLQDEIEQKRCKRSLAHKWIFQYVLCWYYVVLFFLIIFTLLVYFLSWGIHVLLTLDLQEFILKLLTLKKPKSN